MLVIFMEIDTFRQNGRNYVKSAKAAVAAEMVLRIISSYYIGRAAHLATKNGYYSHPGSAPPDARIMYAGALLSLVSLYFTLFNFIYSLFANARFGSLLVMVTLIGYTVWLASWLFWGGFVHSVHNE